MSSRVAKRRIRLIHDRWVGKYAQPWASALSELKKDIESEEKDR